MSFATEILEERLQAMERTVRLLCEKVGVSYDENEPCGLVDGYTRILAEEFAAFETRLKEAERKAAFNHDDYRFYVSVRGKLDKHIQDIAARLRKSMTEVESRLSRIELAGFPEVGERIADIFRLKKKP